MCDKTFLGSMSKAVHQKNFFKTADDPTRCDFADHEDAVANNKDAVADQEDAVADQEDAVADHEDAVADHEDAVADNKDADAVADNKDADAVADNKDAVAAFDDQEDAVADIVAPIERTSLHELSIRPPETKDLERQYRREYDVQSCNIDPAMTPRDMVTVMGEWDKFVQDSYGRCSEKFWDIFLSLHELPAVAIDAALSAVKKTFLQEQIPSERNKFPSSRGKLLRRCNLPSFWPNVMHTTHIDLKDLHMPRELEYVEFKFVDPLFGWLVAARRQRPDNMHWRPLQAINQCGLPIYGGGIQQGLAFQEACRSCPPGAYPMAISLHWDGTGACGLPATPICIGVANCNSTDRSTQFCLGYVPVIPGMGKEFWGTPAGTTAKFHIRQECVAAILRVLEHSAQRGALCPLQNCSGTEVTLLLMPRLLCMNIDQPEAQLYFGMKNRYSCSKCVRRLGYSCFRKSTAQDGDII